MLVSVGINNKFELKKYRLSAFAKQEILVQIAVRKIITAGKKNLQLPNYS